MKIGLFAADADEASAQGHFVHVSWIELRAALYRSATRCARFWSRSASPSCSATLFGAFYS